MCFAPRPWLLLAALAGECIATEPSTPLLPSARPAMQPHPKKAGHWSTLALDEMERYFLARMLQHVRRSAYLLHLAALGVVAVGWRRTTQECARHKAAGTHGLQQERPIPSSSLRNRCARPPAVGADGQGPQDGESLPGRHDHTAALQALRRLRGAAGRAHDCDG